MAMFKRESAFFDDVKRKKKPSGRKMKSLLKKLGGRKGLMISKILLESPKYKDLI